MTEYHGNILKMEAEPANPVRYSLPIGDKFVDMNELLGRPIQLVCNGQINCIACGKRTKTSYGQGFCYNCFRSVPEADASVVHPEMSRAEFGIARDLEWAKANDLIPHYVYLAITGDVKVGVTREHQLPTRWLDQGAIQAIRLAKTPNRHIAGIIETFLKQHYHDITNWHDMLQNVIAHVDLLAEKDKAVSLLPTELQQYRDDNQTVAVFNYPVQYLPQKPVSLTFDKTPEISGTLTGIKGQYLLLDGNNALSIRRHNGYFIQLIT
ncbi:MAG: DUF2797 domain-containing protein [Bacteroidales bacterium]|jgi:hypothetical protein|nr:DUF2797 domain-containing protein [Bacteroidales bacterium]